MRTVSDGVFTLERGSGTPVVMIHGWGVDHRLLLPLDPLFEDHRSGWHRIYVDLPGFGQSPVPPGVDSADDLAERLDDFIDERLGGEPFVVVGNSFGGALARRLVSRRPEQILGFALICPSVLPPERRTLPQPLALAADSRLLDSLDAQVREDFEGNTVHQDVRRWELFRDAVLPGLGAFDREFVDRVTPVLGHMLEKPGTFERPGLIVLGRQDAVVGWEDQMALLRHYPRTTAVVLDGCGHNAHLEHPDVVGAHIRSWLDELG